MRGYAANFVFGAGIANAEAKYAVITRIVSLVIILQSIAVPTCLASLCVK